MHRGFGKYTKYLYTIHLIGNIAAFAFSLSPFLQHPPPTDFFQF